MPRRNTWRRSTDASQHAPALALRMEDDLDRPFLLLLEDFIGVRRIRQRKMVRRERVHAQRVLVHEQTA